MANGNWWQKPTLRVFNEHEERKVSWLELFFDLTFVVIVAQLAHYLVYHISGEGVITFVLLFLPAWWTWIGGTFYNARFETHDVSYRLLVFLMMIPVTVMAVFAHSGLGEGSIGFALAYVAGRALLVFMWMRGGYHEPSIRPLTNRYAIGFGLSGLLFLISIWVAPPLRFVLWGLGLFSDLITPILTVPYQMKLPRLSRGKLPERYGLFVIIVLGEAIVGIIGGVAEIEPLSFSVGLESLISLVLVIGLWWVYFDNVGRREPKQKMWWLVPWSYLHLPLVLSIAAASAGIRNALTGGGHGADAPSHWLLAGSIAVALISIGLIETSLHREPHEVLHHRASIPLTLGAGLAALALAIWGSLDTMALLLVLLVIVLIPIIYNVYAWQRSSDSIEVE